MKKILLLLPVLLIIAFLFLFLREEDVSLSLAEEKAAQAGSDPQRIEEFLSWMRENRKFIVEEDLIFWDLLYGRKIFEKKYFNLQKEEGRTDVTLYGIRDEYWQLSVFLKKALKEGRPVTCTPIKGVLLETRMSKKYMEDYPNGYYHLLFIKLGGRLDIALFPPGEVSDSLKVWKCVLKGGGEPFYIADPVLVRRLSILRTYSKEGWR